MDPHVVAPLWKRWLAASIDGMLFVLPSVPSLTGTPKGVRRVPGSLDVLALAASGAYQVCGTVPVGQTLGQRALGIRVVRHDIGGAPTVSQALLRWAITTVPDGLALFVDRFLTLDDEQALAEMKGLVAEVNELRRQHGLDQHGLDQALMTGWPAPSSQPPRPHKRPRSASHGGRATGFGIALPGNPPPMQVRPLASKLAVALGALMILGGAATALMVRSELAKQNIVTPEDACLAGNEVQGPFTAWCQAQVIDKHARQSTGGLTFAELPREDPRRASAMNASFLRASLFTSIVAYGVAAMAAAIGLLFVLIGLGMRDVDRRVETKIAELQPV